MTRYSATEVNDVVAGRWRRLWRVKSGLDERPDLSGNFRVQLGRFTEGFNLGWLAASREAEFAPLAQGLAPLPDDTQILVHPESGAWARRGRYSARPDGVGRDGRGLFVVEAKHVVDREAPEQVVRSYLGQLHVAMHVLGVRRAVLSVIFGANRLTAYGVPWSEATWQAIEGWVDAFDGHLLLGVEPLDPPEPPYAGLPLPDVTNRWRPERAPERPARKRAPPGAVVLEESASSCVSV